MRFVARLCVKVRRMSGVCPLPTLLGDGLPSATYPSTCADDHS